MDMLDEGLLEFWKTLNKHDVKYIMVGGFAVNMNGYIRSTKNSDLWLKDTLENRRNFRVAYAELGFGDSHLLKHWISSRVGHNFTLPTELFLTL